MIYHQHTSPSFSVFFSTFGPNPRSNRTFHVSVRMCVFTSQKFEHTHTHINITVLMYVFRVRWVCAYASVRRERKRNEQTKPANWESGNEKETDGERESLKHTRYYKRMWRKIVCLQTAFTVFQFHCEMEFSMLVGCSFSLYLSLLPSFPFHFNLRTIKMIARKKSRRYKMRYKK